ncbi:MAG: membrane protein [Pirellulaceae bacterium]|nr:MAG: membrane protein [Pirellulaceae bacterium]
MKWRKLPGCAPRFCTLPSASKMLALLNQDFCPWANRYVYWLKQPIGWFIVGAAAAALTAVFLEPQVWLIFGALVAVMLVGVAWPWVAMRGTSAEIAFDCRRCREGERVQVRLSLHNRWPWPLWGMAVENGFFLEPTETGERPVAALARVPGWSRSEYVFEFRPDARGVYPRSVPELTTGFPFGIWRAAKRISVQRELLVWPRTTPLTSIPSLGGDIADLIGMLLDRPGYEGDVIGVRPFREGDRLRSIHWAQTARREALVVTERQAAARRLVVVEVDVAAFASWGKLPACQDLSRNLTASWKLTPRELETAIRVAASIAQELHAHHAQVRFVMGNLDFLLVPGAASLHQLLDALARFQADPESSRQPGNFGRQAFTVVVTSHQRRPEWESGAGTKGPLRLVLIGSGDEATSVRGRHVWIALDGDSDCSMQICHQWERACHDVA